MILPVPAEEWRVYLGVRSSSLSPDDLTARLGVRAERSSSHSGRRWPYLWEMESGISAGSALEEHLTALARRCMGMTDKIAELADLSDTRVAIEAVLRCAVDLDNPAFPGIWIPPDIVKFAATCGIGIDIDAYPRVVQVRSGAHESI